MLRTGTRFVSALVCVLAACFTLGSAHAKPVYEESFDAADSVPAPWFVPPSLQTSGAEAAVQGTLEDHDAQPNRVLVLSNGSATGQWANVMATIDADGIAGAAFRLSARLRVEAPSGGVAQPGVGTRAQLWCRVDRVGGAQGFFDNSADRPVTPGDWSTAVILGEAQDDAAQLAFGVLMSGRGRVFIDDVRIEIIDDPNAGNIPAAPLTERGVHNLTALAELVALIEHFHPSTESLATDWLAFTTHAVRAVEDAPDDGALARALRSLVTPIAPSVRIWTDDQLEMPDGDRVAIAPPDGASVVGIMHFGRGSDMDGTITAGVYRPEVVHESAELSADARRLPDPTAATTIELVAGVWARVPHVLIDAGGGTLPRPTTERAEAGDERPEGWRPNADDRATRLAGVARAWGLLKHFYPYFDVVHKQTGADWDAALAPALSAVAVSGSHAAYVEAIERLAHHLHDGHAWVSGGPRGGVDSHVAPVEVAWVADDLVAATPAAAGEVQAGDVIESMNGRTIAELAKEHRARVSASTEGFARHRMLTRVLATDAPRATLGVRTRTGERHEVVLDTVPIAVWQQQQAQTGKRPGHLAEIEPGVMYVDLHGLPWMDLYPYLGSLAEADGVIFDLRGYPDSAGAQILQHLTDDPIRSAYWRIPKQSTPTLATGAMGDVDWRESRWNLMPAEPRIGQKDENGRNTNIVFITDGRAISYAESCLAIVEAYGLGEIVGSRTAGTNGNINHVTLPGGVTVVFTGMRVVKHDGETVHQGVGVLPTIEVSRTIEGIAEGRDEVLERAIDAIRRTRSEPAAKPAAESAGAPSE